MNSILKVTLPKEIFHLPLIKGGLVNMTPGSFSIGRVVRFPDKFTSS